MSSYDPAKEKEAQRQTDNGPGDFNDMTDDTEADRDGQTDAQTDVRQEIETSLPGREPFASLKLAHQGGLCYTVLSARDGHPTAHKVDVGDVSCTCEDMQYNREGNEICKHLALALLTHYERVEAEQYVATYALNAAQTAMTAAQSAQNAFEQIDTATVRAREQSASQATQTGESDSGQEATGGPEDMPHTTDPGEAMETLVAAFEETPADMEVELHNDRIWFKTGYEAPDWAFDAYVRDPELATYAPDEDSPGQYFKTYLEPGDVDKYVSEVLE